MEEKEMFQFFIKTFSVSNKVTVFLAEVVLKSLCGIYFIVSKDLCTFGGTILSFFPGLEKLFPPIVSLSLALIACVQ